MASKEDLMQHLWNLWEKSTIIIEVNEMKTDALVDRGSSETFIGKSLVERRGVKEYPSKVNVVKTSTSYHPVTAGFCMVNLKIHDHEYNSMKLVLDRL